MHPTAYRSAALAVDSGKTVAGLAVARAVQPFEPEACGRAASELRIGNGNSPAFSADYIHHVGQLRAREQEEGRGREGHQPYVLYSGWRCLVSQKDPQCHS